MNSTDIPEAVRALYQDQTSRHGDGTLLKDEKTVVQEATAADQAKAAKETFETSLKQQEKDAAEAGKKTPLHKKEVKPK